MNDKIITTIHENGFEEDIWFDNEWMATITHHKYPDLCFHIYFNKDNMDYSFLLSLINATEHVDFHSIMFDIARHLNREDFSTSKLSTIQGYLVNNVNSLKNSLYNIKQWMDAESGNREITYDIYFDIYVNNKKCSFSDLKETEKEIIKKDIYKYLENCEIVNKYHNQFISEESGEN